MTDREYRANAEGLNIVFGATLGFVLAGAENLDTVPFVTVLAFTIGIVVSILYVSASSKRIIYALNALVSISALPLIFDSILPAGSALPAKLQPTLAVWALVSCLIEFVPRTSSAEASKANE